MAVEFNIPIVVTSDLNRSVEHREGYEGKIPQISDLRASSAIENEADSVFLLWRSEYYRIYENFDHKDLHGIGEIIIAKKRNGMTCSMYVPFNYSNCTFGR